VDIGLLMVKNVLIVDTDRKVKIMTSIMLKDLINWDKVMKAPRFAGGHHEIFEVLFKNQEIICSACTGDYQGTVAYIYIVYDWTEYAKFVIINDYYGSCSGCDSWEGATDEDARNMCIGMANNAHSFDTPEEVISFLEEVRTAPKNEYDAPHWDLKDLGAPLLDLFLKWQDKAFTEDKSK